MRFSKLAGWVLFLLGTLALARPEYVAREALWRSRSDEIRWLPLGLPLLFGIGENSAVQSARTHGHFLITRYSLSPHWALVYKLDHLLLDDQYRGDAFWRHGIGADYAFMSNGNLTLRFEKAVVGRSDTRSSNALTARDGFVGMLRLTL